VPAPPPSPPKAAPSPPPPSLLRLSAAYSGDLFAPNRWRSGAAFGVAWVGLAPLYAGASYLLTPAIDVKAPIAFTVERYPACAFAGYRAKLGGLAVDGELGLTLEWLHRTVPQMALGVTGMAASTRMLVGIAPRVRAEFRPIVRLGVFLDGGLDIILNNFKYVTAGDLAAPVLQPFPVRPVAEAGVAFYP
jgi:hypothetical protein